MVCSAGTGNMELRFCTYKTKAISSAVDPSLIGRLSAFKWTTGSILEWWLPTCSMGCWIQSSESFTFQASLRGPFLDL